MNVQYKLLTSRAGEAHEIAVRLYHGRFDQQARTGLYVHPSAWDAAAGRCIISRRFETPQNTQARRVQQALDGLTTYIYNEYTMQHQHLAGWLSETVSRFFNPQQADKPLSEYIEAYCNARNVAPATRRKIAVLGRLLREYGKQHKPLTQHLTRQDLDGFAEFLLSTGERSENTMHCRLRQLRTLLYWVGRPSPNPFDTYTIPQDAYGTPIYLTRDERDYLTLYDDLTEAQKVQRDIFIFQCHVGCRVGDLVRLTPSNVQDGWLVYVPRKTSRANPATVEVPLTQIAESIIERYRGVDTKGRLLPFITEQAYNRAIQTIAKACCLDRPVMVYDPLTQTTQAKPLFEVITSHTARKTFTQILYSATNDKRLVASMTGHSENSQAFNRYSEIDRGMKRNAVAFLQPDFSPERIPEND